MRPPKGSRGKIRPQAREEADVRHKPGVAGDKNGQGGGESPKTLEGEFPLELRGVGIPGVCGGRGKTEVSSMREMTWRAKGNEELQGAGNT